MKSMTRGAVLLALALTAATPARSEAQVVERIVDRIARASERIVERAQRITQGIADAFTDEEGRPVQAVDFRWTGTVAAGEVVEIKGVNGEIVAVPGTGRTVEVTAVRASRRDDPGEVRVEVVEHAGGVTLCAVYPTPRGRDENYCGIGDEGRMSVRDNRVRVDFRVAVPEGVRFRGRTVNGDVLVGELDADADVKTVNGDVDVATRGFAEIATVNGSIRASLGGRDFDDGVTFETVNGSIDLDVADDIDADFEARWVNGGLESDIPIRLHGRTSRRRAEGVLGDGGPRIELKTVNGSIRIR